MHPPILAHLTEVSGVWILLAASSPRVVGELVIEIIHDCPKHQQTLKTRPIDFFFLCLFPITVVKLMTVRTVSVRHLR